MLVILEATASRTNGKEAMSHTTNGPKSKKLDVQGTDSLVTVYF